MTTEAQTFTDQLYIHLVASLGGSHCIPPPLVNSINNTSKCRNIYFCRLRTTFIKECTANASMVLLQRYYEIIDRPSVQVNKAWKGTIFLLLTVVYNSACFYRQANRTFLVRMLCDNLFIIYVCSMYIL